MRSVMLTVLAITVLAGCSKADDTPSAERSDASTTTTIAAPAATGPAPCASSPELQATSTEKGDLDADGGVDEVTADRNQVRVALASGASATLDLPDAPARLLGVADPNENGHSVVLLAVEPTTDQHASDLVEMVVWTECRLAVVTNQQGRPYQFKVGGDGAAGHGSGNGIGCVDADGDGRRDLVGLTFNYSGDDVAWERTIVRIDGDRATNGAKSQGKYNGATQSKEFQLLSRASCGDVVYDTDG